MKTEEVEKKIQKILEGRRGKIVGKNVLKAALSFFTNPGRSVEKLTLGVDSDTSNEKLKIEQELMLDLICKIDDAVNEINSRFRKESVDQRVIILDGLIEVNAKNTNEVIGVEIKNDAGQVEFKPGTKISVSAEGSGNITGLKIGG